MIAREGSGTVCEGGGACDYVGAVGSDGVSVGFGVWVSEQTPFVAASGLELALRIGMPSGRGPSSTTKLTLDILLTKQTRFSQLTQ
jgi:hypothetical protein